MYERSLYSNTTSIYESSFTVTPRQSTNVPCTVTSRKSTNVPCTVTPRQSTKVPCTVTPRQSTNVPFEVTPRHFTKIGCTITPLRCMNVAGGHIKIVFLISVFNQSSDFFFSEDMRDRSIYRGWQLSFRKLTLPPSRRKYF